MTTSHKLRMNIDIVALVCGESIHTGGRYSEMYQMTGNFCLITY